MRPPRRRYSLDQIVQAERWAWASSRGDDVPDLYFDGAVFWRGSKGEQRAPAGDETMPAEGWWHAADCVCGLCRPSSRSRETG